VNQAKQDIQKLAGSSRSAEEICAK